MCSAHYKRTLVGRSLYPPFRKRRALGTVLIRDAEGLKRCTACDGWKPESDFNARTCSADGLQPRCRPCERTYKRKAVYGLDAEQLSAILESQGGLCGACGASEPGGPGWWQIDHNHACCDGRLSCGACVRGLLCSRCNSTLGYVKDNPAVLRALVDYLERTTS